MARAPRLQFPGAYYHAYHRGNRRERVFWDDQDYARFEAILIEAMNWSGVRLYTWKLMPNHFHLAVETPDGNLAEFMQRLLSRYAKYFNGRHRLIGHVFQGRYGANVCDKEAYFLELIRYIQLNAYRTKGKSLAAPGQWRWSSHRYHVGSEKPPEGTAEAFQLLLERFGKTPDQARANYAKFLADGLRYGNWEDFYKVKSSHFIGDDAFVERSKGQTGQVGRSQSSRLRRMSGIHELIAIVEGIGGPDRETLACENRQADLSRWRQAVAYVGRRFYRFSVLEIGQALGRDATSVSHMLRRVRDREEMIPEIARLLVPLDGTPR